MKFSEYEKINNHFCIVKKLTSSNVKISRSHYHNSCEIIYTLKGEAAYNIRGQDCILKPGDMIFMNTYELHQSLWHSDDFERILITYKRTFVESNPLFKVPDIFKMLDEKHNSSRHISIPEMLQHELKHIFVKLLECRVSNNPYALTYQNSYFLIFLVTLVDYLDTFQSDNAGKSYGDQRIRNILSYINDNLGKDLSLDNIATNFNMSKFYLCRVFREGTGMSPIDYINRMRIIKAEKLINQSKHSITDISNITGFNNLTHFERVFKKIMGTSPRSYRKSMILQMQDKIN